MEEFNNLVLRAEKKFLMLKKQIQDIEYENRRIRYDNQFKKESIETNKASYKNLIDENEDLEQRIQNHESKISEFSSELEEIKKTTLTEQSKAQNIFFDYYYKLSSIKEEEIQENERFAEEEKKTLTKISDFQAVNNYNQLVSEIQALKSEKSSIETRINLVTQKKKELSDRLKEKYLEINKKYIYY